jgi:hypothetical protein
LDTYQNTQKTREVSLVSIQAVREYLALVWRQYQVASKGGKSELLNEIVKNVGLHRGSAKRLMNRRTEPKFRRGKGVSVNAYGNKSRQLLVALWKDMGYLGAVRMKGAIGQWLKFWKHPDLDDYTHHELKLMSASTLERILRKEKAQWRRRSNTGTQRAAGKVKTLIPIRDLAVKPDKPGHCEIDCVAHCGGSLTGSHIWTLTLTDIVTGHTECEALEAKNGFEVMLALHRIEDRLPFKLLALYMDNGSEFINDDVHKRFSQHKAKLSREQVIELFRSRPYKKNDQCHVEQKNYTHVRELFGYDRLSGPLMVSLMNNIYRQEWRSLSNYFHPQIRLKSKVRIGSKIKRTFHPPATPFTSLKRYLSEEKAKAIQAEIDGLDPFMLVKKLKRKLRDFQAYNSRHPGSARQTCDVIGLRAKGEDRPAEH